MTTSQMVKRIEDGKLMVSFTTKLTQEAKREYVELPKDTQLKIAKLFLNK